jgi:hypothetical protein
MNSNRGGLCIYIITCAFALCSTQSVFAQTNPEPCKMLTQTEVSAATGVSVGAGQSLGGTCSWSGTPKVIVSLWYPGPALWAGIQHPNPPVSQTPASGVGDAAFYNTLGAFTSLGVQKGSTVFVVKIYGIADPSKQMAIEKALAANVIAKM